MLRKVAIMECGTGSRSPIPFPTAAGRLRQKGVGQWSTPTGIYEDRQGAPLKPAAKAAHLRHVRGFFRDLLGWKWIPQRFDPTTVFKLPHAITMLIGPDPRIVADHTWAKLVSAGLNLTEKDRPVRSMCLPTGVRRPM